LEAQQQRLHPVDQHFEAGQVTRVGVEDSVRPTTRRADVAMAVHHANVSPCLSVRRGLVAGPVAGM